MGVRGLEKPMAIKPSALAFSVKAWLIIVNHCPAGPPKLSRKSLTQGGLNITT
jgi:hypothetical protein